MEGLLGLRRVSVATGELEAPLAASRAFSSGDAWRGMSLDHSTLLPADLQEGYLTHHSVVVHAGAPVRLEASWPGERPRVTLIPAGAVTIVPAGVPYRARWDGPFEMITVRLCAEGPGSLMPEGPRSLLRLVIAAGDALLRDLVLALLKDAQGTAKSSAPYAEALGSAMVAHLLRQYGTPSLAAGPQRGGLPKRRLKELRDYVEEHLAAPLHLPQLAELVGSSVRQFARAFKESTALTPHQFVLLRRIERAKALLASSNLPVGEIAIACGFASQSRFTSAFRRVTRATPSAYRSTSG
jgi:AraC family transcriptional regulator